MAENQPTKTTRGSTLHPPSWMISTRSSTHGLGRCCAVTQYTGPRGGVSPPADGEWGWWYLLAEMGMTCWRRTCWRCFLSQNFHELHVNVQWWSLSAYLKVKSGEKWLQVPQSSISLKFDLHPFCWRNVRTTPQVHRILEEAKLPEVSEAERRPQCEEISWVEQVGNSKEEVILYSKTRRPKNPA